MSTPKYLLRAGGCESLPYHYITQKNENKPSAERFDLYLFQHIHAVLLFASINSFPSLLVLLSFIIAFTLGCSLESYICAPKSMQFNGVGMPRSHPVGYQHTHYYLLAFIHLRPLDNHILFIWYDSSFGSQCNSPWCCSSSFIQNLPDPASSNASTIN